MGKVIGWNRLDLNSSVVNLLCRVVVENDEADRFDPFELRI